MPLSDDNDLQIHHFVSKAPTAGDQGWSCMTGFKDGSTNELSMFSEVATGNVSYKPRNASNPVLIGNVSVEGYYALSYDQSEATDSQVFIDGVMTVQDAAAGAVVSQSTLNFYALALNDGGANKYNSNAGIAIWGYSRSMRNETPDLSIVLNDYVQNTLPCSAGVAGLSDSAGTSSTTHVGERSTQVVMPKDGWISTLWSYNANPNKDENSCQMAIYSDVRSHVQTVADALPTPTSTLIGMYSFFITLAASLSR